MESFAKRRCEVKRPLLAILAAAGTALLMSGPGLIYAADSGVGSVPQGTQSDTDYSNSVLAAHVSNVFATTQKVSCYTPEVPFFTNNGPAEGYSGMSPCNGAATTGENLGPYPIQSGSNPGFPASTPMLVKNHSESDIRVDPTNPLHLIGTSKWAVSAEGYNHELGFYESRDGGKTWPVQGHIPGYEGWTDNTDPVGAFDPFGNFYELILPYQFFYNADGSHNFSINPNQEPNPSVPAEVISVAVRPKDAKTATDWTTMHNGQLDIVHAYPNKGNEPDKQWITIDNNPESPHFGRIYAMWVDFTGPFTAHPVVSFADARRDGTHTDWAAPIPLPQAPTTPQGATYLLPHVTPDGNVWTTLTTTLPGMKFSFDTIALDRSTDGGQTWTNVSVVASNIAAVPGQFANTTFRDGIENTFATGTTLVSGHYPLYVAWEDYSAGVDNVLLSASNDGGVTWSAPIQVNDNQQAVDEFQPNLAVAASGTVSVNFYDRRLACPAAGTEEAMGAGLALDTANPKSPNVIPYGAANYCVNASAQLYGPTLTPIGHNIRLTQHTWDPQLNSLHPGRAAGELGFIGDYFGNVFGGSTDYATFVSTFNDGGSNPDHRQQQVVAAFVSPS
jgi:hypothetical protein